MGIQNNALTFHAKAAEDLSNTVLGTGVLYKAFAIDDQKLANNGNEAAGLLCQGGQSGNHVAFTVVGIEKFVAGGSVTAGSKLTVTTSGYLKSAVAGDYVVGRSVETITVNSGSVGTGLFDFAKPALFDTTGEVTTSEDLSGAINKAIDAGGAIADDSNDAIGVLVANADSGTAGRIVSTGNVEWKAGGVITAGQSLLCSSGWAAAADSGDLIVGRALDASAAGNSGSTFTAIANFGAAHYATSCLDVQY